MKWKVNILPKSVAIDTCVWLDLANGSLDEKLLELLQDLVEKGAIQLILPEQVYFEWNKRKNNLSDSRELQNFKASLSAINKIYNDTDQTTKEIYLEPVSQYLREKIDEIKFDTDERIDLIEQIINHPKTLRIEINDSLFIYKQAVELSLKGQAPFHNKKASMGDALIFLSVLGTQRKQLTMRHYL
ncbi:PIN domain-containing protein [Cohnella panacarvi]|uniref:PIN domain-containing protein n=1 Tax=Cohnella panacarvi TaxID=400776 RepID=UPI0012EB8C45|nr:PIN domain-containing protein [Cohnella panacarvi]